MATEQHVLVKESGDLYRFFEKAERTLDAVSSRSEEIEKKTRELETQAREATEAKAMTTELRTQIEKVLADMAAERAEIVAVKEDNIRLRERCDILDKNQEKGSKFYALDLPANTSEKKLQAIRAFSEYLVDGGRARLGLAPAFGHFTRTGPQLSDAATTGLELVPVPIMAGVQWLRSQYGLARKLCSVIQMTSDTMWVPTSTVAPSISYPGQATAPTPDAVYLTAGPPTITAYKATATDNIPVEFFQDVTPGSLNFVTERFVESMNGEEERMFLAASNTPTSTLGCLYATGVGVANLGNSTSSGSTSFHNIAYLDLVRTMAACDERVHETGEWVFSSYTLDQLRTIVDTQGRPIFAPMEVGAPSMLLGRPWHVSPKMPKLANSGASTAFVLYGDYKKTCFFGERMGTEVAFSEHVHFDQAVVMLRIMQRHGFLLALPAGVSRLRTSAT